MRRPYYPWSLAALLRGRPTLGGLLELCDENYGLLLRLAPELPRLRGHHCTRAEDGVALHLEIQAQTPYTSLLRLTHRFQEGVQEVDDPAAGLRVYHDARQLEVLELRQQALPLIGQPYGSALQRKWRLNLFLSKWLGYCLRQGYYFGQHSQCPSASDQPAAANRRPLLVDG
ncbi:DUF1249 domain-containing protein [Magnetovirga frankeli]|uniref:DUF1249 domain-containing protein n=1 Tax=Magnetovirga frankeli TaxID=947516 RepID=UPI00129329AC|nr:DUF1249 domain-containing protein [gamma proteobacterium SS-5]